MTTQELVRLRRKIGDEHWRVRWATWIESSWVQYVIVGVILFNAIVLAFETDRELMKSYGVILRTIDQACLAFFCIELAIKLVIYRGTFWRSGWNVFDFMIVGIALLPSGGAWSVLRALRVLRVLRLLTIVPSMRRVVAAFIHAIPGLSSVIAVMGIFYFTGAVLATKLFGESHPQWFGNIGASLYSLFQIMTLESWSMGIVRPVMEVHPWAWAFFVPFIIVATFTILNLFIGIIVSTMQELAQKERDEGTEVLVYCEDENKNIKDAIQTLEKEVARLKIIMDKMDRQK